MKEKDETILLRKLLEEGDVNPAPEKVEYSTPHYELIIGIGKDHTASIFIDEDAYFELMENDEYSE